MDFLQDWLRYAQSNLSPSTLRTLYTFFLSITNTLLTLRSFINPLLSRLTTSPDLASIAILIIILFFSLKILGMAYRAVMFWVNLALRLVFWGSIVLGGLYVYNRGVDGAVGDVGELWQYWLGQYEHYQMQAELSKTGMHGGSAGGYGGRKRGREGWR